MECPICYNLIKKSCVGSCMHHYCYECYVKWIVKTPSCPICKMPVFEIKLDKEFDNLNNPNFKGYIEKVTRNIVLDFKDQIPPGITLVNNSNGPGVKVLRLKKEDSCYLNGMRENDIILFINSVPCNTHQHAIEIINEFYNKKKKINFELFI